MFVIDYWKTTNFEYSLIEEESLESETESKGTETQPLVAPIESVVNRYPPRRYRNIQSTWVVLFCAFVSEMSKGVMFASMWLLVLSMGGTTTEMGIIITAYDAGRILSSPTFSALTETWGYRQTLVASNSLMIFGFLIYAHFSILGPNCWFPLILAAQYCIGMGGAIQGVTRAYFCETTHTSERTSYLSWLIVMKYGGQCLTPILGAYISWHYTEYETGSSEVSLLRVNQYTAPAFFLAVTNLLCINALFIFFSDIPRDPLVNPIQLKKIMSAKKNTDIAVLQSTTEKFEWITKLVNVPLQGTFRVFDTLVLSYAISQYHWTSWELSVLISMCGVVAVVYLSLFNVILWYVKEVKLVTCGMVCMTISCFLLIRFCLFGSPRFFYCGLLPKGAFYFAIVLMYAVGYPLSDAAYLGVWSKMVKQGPQGIQQGQWATMGNAAKMIFPVASGLMVSWLGYSFTFLFFSILLLLSTLLHMSVEKEINFVINS